MMHTMLVKGSSLLLASLLLLTACGEKGDNNGDGGDTPDPTPTPVVKRFVRSYSFPVNTNLPADVPNDTETSAEIISASADGMTLVYSDSPLGAIGMIDISDPTDPKPAGVVSLGGEPTAVSVSGAHALVGLNTSETYTNPSGELIAVAMESQTVVARCTLPGQPDSTAVAPDNSFIAIAIENERDEDLNDGDLPQLPAGSLAILSLATDGAPLCESLQNVDLTGLAEVAPSDPEPEFVDINSDNEIVVTLQENNHIVVLSAAGEILSHFSAGTVDLDNVDVEEEGALTFAGTLRDVPREPDAVQWLDNDRFATANEGDYQGGSRGFSIFSQDGSLLYDSGMSFEYEVVKAGHYPEKRSGNKGAEPEGMEVKTFGDDTYIFVLSERGSVIGVYKDEGADQVPSFVQLLPTALAPEGAVAIPTRNLLAVSNEADLIDDGGVRSHVTLYTYAEQAAAYPHIISVAEQDGRLVGFGALSGMVADPSQPARLYAVNDSFYSQQPTIFTIDASKSPAQIIAATRVTRDGAPAQKLDMEGITTDGEGGFWIASEGKASNDIPHALYHVDADGVIQQQIDFPQALLEYESRFGAEGITMVGETLWIAMQREWDNDPDGKVKLLGYTPTQDSWQYLYYPLESAAQGWVGLSEITAHGDNLYIIERDNQIGQAARIKRLYAVPISALADAVMVDDEAPTVSKQLVHDFLPDLRATGGYVLDKIEGFAIDSTGTGYAVTDNDGVDDSNGETLFFSIGITE